MDQQLLDPGTTNSLEELNALGTKMKKEEKAHQWVADDGRTLTNVKFKRGQGVILPIFSLPEDYGIGTFGKEAYRFVQFLKESGMRYWQLLPLGQTSYGDSPYSCFSSFAGNPYFIDLDALCDEGLLSKEELEPINFFERKDRVNYGLQYNNRYRVLRKAFEIGFEKERSEVEAFVEKNEHWIKDYALFMALKQNFMDVSWTEWPDEYRYRKKDALENFYTEHESEIQFRYYTQYKFYQQWKKLRDYAHENDIEFIGDLPIYVAMDSVDVWANSEEFLLDEKLEPTVISGAPPDMFSTEGQRWGNPIYDWKKMKETGYQYWIRRVKHYLELFDIVRLDHFVGFANYWSVPAQEETAKNGQWTMGPGLDFFLALEDAIGPLPFIVEDLGILNNYVLQVRSITGFPGMNPLQFAFDETDSSYQPHNFEKRTTVYTSTHDSDTIVGWWNGLSLMNKELVSAYFHIEDDKQIHWDLMRGACQSVADICIYQMQDILGLDNDARMNLPASVGSNWQWRMDKEYFDRQISEKLRELAVIYGRI